MASHLLLLDFFCFFDWLISDLFSGWTKRVEYTPGSGSIPLFPSLHLETCEETVWNIQATVELQTGHIGKGCDRDSYSDRSVRRLCGESCFIPVSHESGGIVAHIVDILSAFVRCCSGRGGPPPTSIPCSKLDLSSSHPPFF